jgi:hypothetical protein
MADFEKPGAFYLGREVDRSGKSGGDLLYDSKDLVTHAVIVGMTGSGKTGLAVALLEEAAIDGIPAIVVDPKGDLGNLLLGFPNLAPADFLPWIDPEEGRRKGLEPEAYAAAEAERWRKGLAEWGEDPARIARLREAAEFTIYTPGSEAGVPVSVLASLDCPAGWGSVPEEEKQERIAGVVASILALAGVEADPVGSREQILLSLIVADCWGKGRGLRMEELVRLVLVPPFDLVGALPLEEFFPAKGKGGEDRSSLSLKLNTLIASPSFGRWRSGERLDVGAMLRTPSGRPRISIFSIAHLPDSERMFFVSLLASETVAWMRRQSGTTSLRAIFFMDEIAGYFPPSAVPPSKPAMLTMLKQGRAFGLGCVLATQNPADLDYKGLTNAGTWFVGRLQAERDKMRLLDGLESAGASSGRGLDRGEIDGIISGLPGRTFLMNNVHDDGPVLFQSRWALSYLRGPLTRAEITRLTKDRVAAPPAPLPAAPTGAATPVPVPAGGESPAPSHRPALPPDLPQSFLPARARFERGGLHYRPLLLGAVRIGWRDAKTGIDSSEGRLLAAAFGTGTEEVDWDAAERLEVAETDLGREPEDEEAGWDQPPASVSQPRKLAAWKKALADSLYRTARLKILASPSTGLFSSPEEGEREFRARLDQRMREERDAEVEKVRTETAKKLEVLGDRLQRAEQRLEREKQERTSAGLDTAISVGGAILGALLGRKKLSASNVGRAASAARSLGRAARQQGDVANAEESSEQVRERIRLLEEETGKRIEEIALRLTPQAEKLESVEIRPKKTDIEIRFVALGWRPFERAGGEPLDR